MNRWAVGLALGALLAAGPVGAGAGDGPHGAWTREGDCERCHLATPDPGAAATAGLRKDVVGLCLECHRDKDLSALHPVDIRPGAQVPDDLPLDDHGTITCATCHDPHGPYEADEPYVAQALSRRLLSLLTGRRRYRTFYLRRRNDEGQLCLACHDRNLLAAEGFHVQEASRLDQYVGSPACASCHPRIYAEWKKTPHARMTRDARQEPGAVLARFEGDRPFPPDEIVYALGSHWTQRYVVAKEGRLLVKAAIWSIPQQTWDTSYWIDKPWTQYCQGCHTTGFEMKDEPRFAELGIGCEACHGPGRRHAESGGSGPVVHPARLDPVRRDMICEACHTTGHDRSGQFRFPLGYLPGSDLTRFFKGLLPKPGQDNETFAGDESYEDRHRQWVYWKETVMDAKGVTCDVCKNFRSRLSPSAVPRMTPSEYCLSCHRDRWPGDRLHTAHLEAEVHCHRCHAPKRTADGRSHSIHDHKFLFQPPEGGPAETPGAACGSCHGSVARTEGG
ncbi:MAG: hypothetical protein Kow0092_18090 [Deferrisomatales bacterium]